MSTFDPNSAAAPSSGIFGLDSTPENASVVLVPVPFEATTSYGAGTAQGPEAILRASHQVDLYDLETGRPYESGIVMLPQASGIRSSSDRARPLAKRVMDAGGRVGEDSSLRAALDEVNGICDQVNAHVQAEVTYWMELGKLVGLVGGDHSVSFGAIAAHAERHFGLGVLHIDAHADLRREYEGFTWSHASIMENVTRRIPQLGRLVQVGIRDLCEEEKKRIDGSQGRIRTYYDAELARERFEGVTWAQQVERIVSDLPEAVYISFDIDGLDPVLCPGTGTPVPGGLSFNQASALVGAVARSGRHIVGFDLVEVAPGPTGGEWDGNVGARMLYKLIGWALCSQQ